MLILLFPSISFSLFCEKSRIQSPTVEPAPDTSYCVYRLIDLFSMINGIY